MQTYVFSFASPEAREAGRDAIYAVMGPRYFDSVDKAPLQGEELEAPVVTRDENGPPQVVSPGRFGPSTWPLEIVIHDSGPAPTWGEGLVPTNATHTSLDIPPAPPAAALSADTVRAETLRRLLLAFGARDQQHLSIKVQDAVVRAGALTDKLVRGETLSTAEAVEAQHLRQANGLYLAIKACGNAFEAQAQAGQLAAEFATSTAWPSVPWAH